MADEESNDFVLEVSLSDGETTHWMVSWATKDATAAADDQFFESRDDAIEHAKARALKIKDPVRIIAHEGHGRGAEKWLVDEWSPFHEPDGRSETN